MAAELVEYFQMEEHQAQLIQVEAEEVQAVLLLLLVQAVAEQLLFHMLAHKYSQAEL